MSDVVLGMTGDGNVYTTRALAELFGVKQYRTIEAWLDSIDCPVTRIGSRAFVSGRQFRLAIEQAAVAKERTGDDGEAE